MKSIARLAAALALAFAPMAQAGSISPPTTTKTVPYLYGALNRPSALHITGQTFDIQGSGHFTLGTDYSATSRDIYTANGQTTLLQLCWGQTTPTATGEGVGTAPFIVRVGIETTSPAQTTPVYNATGGRDIVVPTTGVVCHAPTAVYIPAGATYYVRPFARVAAPPTAPSAAVTTVNQGALTASQQYFCKVTNLDTGLESGATSEVTFTTGTSTRAGLISWTNPAFTSGANVYCSTTTGTEKYITTLPVGQTSYLYDGNVTAGAASPPTPSASVYFAEPHLLTGDSNNRPVGGGDGSDQSLATGAMTARAGPLFSGKVAPSLILSNDESIPGYLFLGDSIEWGGGLPTAPTGANFYGLQSFVGQAVTASQNPNLPYLNNSIIGSQLQQLLNQLTGGAAIRTMSTTFADDVFTEFGSNDIVGNNVTALQTATNMLALGKILAENGQRLTVGTLLPRVTTTDGLLTTTNQTAPNGTNETQRQTYNTWVRNGFLQNAGTPCFTAGCGTQMTIAGIPVPFTGVDLAATVEVNSSNTPTLNGGYWKVPTSASFSGTLTGVPTTTSLPCSGCTLPTTGYGLVTYEVVMTSGAASGQRAFVTANTATSLTLLANGSTYQGTLALPGLTTTPAAGDTFQVWRPLGSDGIHPSQYGASQIAVPVTAWINATLAGYGATGN